MQFSVDWILWTREKYWHRTLCRHLGNIKYQYVLISILFNCTSAVIFLQQDIKGFSSRKWIKAHLPNNPVLIAMINSTPRALVLAQRNVRMWMGGRTLERIHIMLSHISSHEHHACVSSRQMAMHIYPFWSIRIHDTGPESSWPWEWDVPVLTIAALIISSPEVSLDRASMVNVGISLSERYTRLHVQFLSSWIYHCLDFRNRYILKNAANDEEIVQWKILEVIDDHSV